MEAPTAQSSDRGLLETVHELWAPLFISFVVATAADRYLGTVGLDLIGDLLVLLVAVPLVVAAAGLLREFGARFGRRRSTW